MRPKKKREFQASELVKSFAKIYGFENKVMAMEIRKYLQNYLDSDLYNEIEIVNINDRTLELKIKSPLLKNDFKLRKSFFLKKFQDEFGEDVVSDLLIY